MIHNPIAEGLFDGYAKIQSGSYVGTGSTTAGPVINSDFEIKFVIVQGGAGTAFFLYPNNDASTTIQFANVSSVVLNVTWQPTSLTWRLARGINGNEDDMLNASGTRYYYLIFG